MGDVVNLRATGASAIHQLHRDHDPIRDDVRGLASPAQAETSPIAAEDTQDAAPQPGLTTVDAAPASEREEHRPRPARVCACDSPLPCIDDSEASCAKCGCGLDPVRHLRLLIVIQRRRQPALRPAEDAALRAIAS